MICGPIDTSLGLHCQYRQISLQGHQLVYLVFFLRDLWPYGFILGNEYKSVLKPATF